MSTKRTAQVSLSRNLRIKPQHLSEVELYTLHFYMTKGNGHTF